MLDTDNTTRTQVIDPAQRVAEVLFGLIMVLTFTGSLSVADSGRDDVRVMLIGALGCNLAWGVIDGIFFLMSSLAEKGSSLQNWNAVRNAATPQVAHRVIADAIPPKLAGVLEPADLENMRQKLLQLPEPPAKAGLESNDWLGALGVTLLVFLSTFPVALPFMFMQQTQPAMRASNAIAIVMLFIAGYAYGRCIGRSPWFIGGAMVVLGSVLTAMCIALGG